MNGSKPVLPEAFRHNVLGIWGADGKKWLQELPGQVETLAARWELTIDPPFPGLSYNYAAPGLDQQGRPIVLKIGFPREELTREIAALRIYAGRGICSLTAADESRGAMVLERLTPGHLLTTETDDDAATRIAADIMRQLWRPLSPAEKQPFRHVREWAADLENIFEKFEGGTGPFPSDLIHDALDLLEDLLATSGPEVLLHGDLHHFNILNGQDGRWVAIDPKGMIGEAAFEAYALLKNPLPAIYDVPDLKRVLARRLDILAETLALDRTRLRDWGIAMAVVSAWWGHEDRGRHWKGALKVARVLQKV